MDRGYKTHGVALLALLGLASASLAPLTLYDPSAFPLARCLDGSPSGYYLQKARNASVANSWLIVLNGGGACTHEADCTARAATDLGSSKGWAPAIEMNKIDYTTNDTRNPFADWNLVFAEYCDGSEHTGTRTEATNETFGLFFSGHHSIDALVTHLDSEHGLGADGNRVLFGGGSAGGVGTFANYEYVTAKLPKAQVLGAPIGGFPPPLIWYSSHHAGGADPVADLRDSAFRDHNNGLYQAYLPAPCAAAKAPEDAWQCAVPHFLYPHLTVPVFITEALSDVTVMCGFEGMPCNNIAKALLNKNVTSYIAEYAQNASDNFQQVLGSTRDGVYAASCLLHCGFLLDQPLIDGVGAIDALFLWGMSYFEPASSLRTGADHKYIDSPCTSITHLTKKTFYPPCGKSCPTKISASAAPSLAAPFGSEF